MHDDELALLEQYREGLRPHLERLLAVVRDGDEPATVFQVGRRGDALGVASPAGGPRDAAGAAAAGASASVGGARVAGASGQPGGASAASRGAADAGGGAGAAFGGVPAYLSLAEAGELIRARQLSSVELTRSRLARIEALDGRLNAFVTLTADAALAAAEQADRELASGTYRGPLHGMPLALKDLYLTAGVRTTAHSHVLADWVPTEDAVCVTRLREAGAVLLGKLAMSEWATGSVLEGPFPPARNPWNLAHVPGVSSSGSGAAVAAGLCFGALGSDTGGSIRGQAAHCGIVGIRPTYGRVSRQGVLPLCWSLDTAGPLAPTARDCALILNAIAGYDPADPGSADVAVPDFTAGFGRGLAAVRVGVDRGRFLGEGIDAEVRAAVEVALAVLAGLGAAIVEIELPSLDDAPAALHAIHSCEAHAYHAERLARVPELYGPTVRGYFRVGAFLTGADYLRAQRVRARIRDEMLAALRQVDLIAAPTQNAPAEPFERIAPGPARFNRASPMQPFSLVGVPAASVPCGFSAAGLPIGLQLAGRPFHEATVLAAADAYAAATPWQTMHPPL